LRDRPPGWRLGITRREFVAIEVGERPPNADQYEAIYEFFGWAGREAPDPRRARDPDP
jgi:hypothetical protein